MKDQQKECCRIVKKITYDQIVSSLTQVPRKEKTKKILYTKILMLVLNEDFTYSRKESGENSVQIQ